MLFFGCGFAGVQTARPVPSPPPLTALVRHPRCSHKLYMAKLQKRQICMHEPASHAIQGYLSVLHASNISRAFLLSLRYICILRSCSSGVSVLSGSTVKYFTNPTPKVHLCYLLYWNADSGILYNYSFVACPTGFGFPRLRLD